MNHTPEKESIESMRKRVHELILKNMRERDYHIYVVTSEPYRIAYTIGMLRHKVPDIFMLFPMDMDITLIQQTFKSACDLILADTVKHKVVDLDILMDAAVPLPVTVEYLSPTETDTIHDNICAGWGDIYSTYMDEFVKQPYVPFGVSLSREHYMLYMRLDGDVGEPFDARHKPWEQFIND